MVVLEAVVWTYWIAPLLVAAVIAVLVLLAGVYLYTVVRPQYPPGKFPFPGSGRRH